MAYWYSVIATFSPDMAFSTCLVTRGSGQPPAWPSYPGNQSSTSPGDLKVIRGGCFADSKEQATTRRMGLSARGNDYTNIGFRCAKDVF